MTVDFQRRKINRDAYLMLSPLFFSLAAIIISPSYLLATVTRRYRKATAIATERKIRDTRAELHIRNDEKLIRKI